MPYNTTQMSLIAIIGPMKSGKSLELLSRIAPYSFADQKVVLVQHLRNVRDSNVSSRIGLSEKAQKVDSLEKVADDFDVIGIDEIHMFEPADIRYIEKWVLQGKEVFVSGLDVSYDRKMPLIMQRIFELKPDQIVDKIAVCETCKQYTARYTKILKNGRTIRSGLPSVVPEDGTYTYISNCRNCFAKNK